jgi:hypothetical protein
MTVCLVLRELHVSLLSAKEVRGQYHGASILRLPHFKTHFGVPSHKYEMQDFHWMNKVRFEGGFQPPADSFSGHK